MRPQIGIPAARKAASCAAGSVRRCGLPMLQRITPRSQTMDTSRAYRESRPTVWSGGRRSVSTPAASSSARKCSYSAHAAVASGGVGEYTARAFVTAYLERLDARDRRGPPLGAVLEVNPGGRTQAPGLAAERSAKGPSGPPDGIRLRVKGSVATRDRLHRTGGSRAL